MITFIRKWLAETHGETFELVRHFLARFIDTELGANSSDWQKVAIGMFASLASLGIAGFETYYARFTRLQNPTYSNPDLYRAALRDDLILALAIVMAITSVLTLLQWRSLFPSLRDYMALTGFPVSARQIFAAKFSALVLLFGAFAMALTAPLAWMFAAIVSGHWQENPSTGVIAAANFAALAGGCAFVFFSLLAIQGLLLNLVPGRWFLRVSLLVQAGLFIATVGALPLAGRQPASAGWWPPVWFVRLWEAIVLGRLSQATPALLAITLPSLLAVLSYLLSYHRYRKLLLEAPPHRPGGHWSGLGSRLLERWIPDAREQAAFAFIWKTLSRSWFHRLLLLAYAGLALGWVVRTALDAGPVTLHDQGMYGFLAVAAPFALAVLMILALRYLFALPVSLQANWMFQTADRESRTAWLAAVERFVIACGIAPVFLASLPASIAVFGWLRALGVTAMSGLVALICFERLFRDWCKLPFACSYLPGKRPVWWLLLRSLLAIVFFAGVPAILLTASGELASFLAVFTGLVMFWRWWRGKRLAQWAVSELVWRDIPPADIEGLHLRPSEEELSVAAAPRRENEMFSAGLVASRGLLPEDWAEEIAEDRHDPRILLATFWADVRYGCRIIASNPLLSLVVVLTLTVGIGINASVFTVVDGMMLRPHVYKDAASFRVIVPEARLQREPRPASYQEYVNLRDHNRTLRQLAAYSTFPVAIGDDDALETRALAVSCNFFLVDGLDRALLGRLIDAGDCLPGQAPVAVISETVWHQRFASDPHIAGLNARMNGRSVTIAGVAPDLTTAWLPPPSVWLPYNSQPFLDFSPAALTDEKQLWLNLVGRMAPGSSPAEVRAEFEILERQEDRLHPGRSTTVTTTDGSWLETFELNWTGRQLFLLAFFLGAFTLVLLIACANVATLLLSRAASRRREIAVRLSLGAPRVRLVRMLLTESLLMAACAGIASAWLVRHVPYWLFRYVAPGAPDYPMNPDWRIFLYVCAVVLLSGFLSGLAPALESVKVDLTSSLKGYSRLTGGARLRAALVSAQVAMSMVLLVAAALFAKSEERTLHADPGYLPQKVVVAPLRFPNGMPLVSTKARADAIAARVKSLPGVHSVAFSDELPMLVHGTVELHPPRRTDAVQAVDIYSGSAGFFDTMGLPIVRGREFEEADGPSLVVSRLLARTFWPGEDPLGKSLTVNGINLPVVGVAEDIDPVRFGGSENPPVYVKHFPRPYGNFMAVRFNGDAKAGAMAVRAALREFDLWGARVLQSWIDQVTDVLWNIVSLIVVLGLVATVLATTGIYGAVSFAVNQGSRDLGIRLALGATRLVIVREVFLSGGRPVLRGLFVGLWLSVALAASLRQNMSGTPLRLDSSDPLLYGGAALLLALAAVLAMAGPAQRGSKANPLDAMRCD